MTYQFRLALLIPALAVLTIVVFAGGIGVIFMVLESSFGEWGVIGLGVGLTVGVPSIAALLESRIKSV